MSRTTGRTNDRVLRVVYLAFPALILGGCLGNYAYSVTAPPVASTVRYVESSPDVARELGAPVKVSLVTTRTLRRNPVRAFLGDDDVSVLTRAAGSRGEAWLRISARNVGGQGWAGDFALDGTGTSVLRGGTYVTEGAGPIVKGTFNTAGQAIATLGHDPAVDADR